MEKMISGAWPNKNLVKISVSIPTFNRIGLLKRVLDSVFNQVVPPDEIIVVDDASTDGTWEYLKKVSGIRAVQNEKNLGMIGNWNESIRQAKYDYVVSLHSDDLILPEYIKIWKEKISGLKNPDKIAAFISGGFVIDSNDRIRGLVKNFDKDILSKPPKTIKSWWKNHLFCVPVTGWTVYNKKILEDIGYFTTKYRIAAENEMTARMIPNYPVFYSSTPLFCFRRHGLQGFDGKVKIFSSKQEIENTINAIKVLKDYERRPEVKVSFSPTQRKERIFLRQPMIFFLVAGIFFLFAGDKKRGQAYLKLFSRHYPKPIYSFTTLKLLAGWLHFLTKEAIRNNWVRFRARGKSVFDCYRAFSFQRRSIPW